MPSPPTGPCPRVRLGGGLVLGALSCALLALPDRPLAAGVPAATPVVYAHPLALGAQPLPQGPVGDRGETTQPRLSVTPAGGTDGSDIARVAAAAARQTPVSTADSAAPVDVSQVVLGRHAGQQLDGAAGLGAAPAAVAALRFALTHLGDRYVWGATGPDTWDCSALVQAAYRSAGFELPRVAADQAAVGRAVTVADLLPGDLVFFATGTTRQSIHHVALYLGNGLVVHAPHTGAVVQVSPLWFDDYAGAVRVTAGVGGGLTAVPPSQQRLPAAAQPGPKQPESPTATQALAATQAVAATRRPVVAQAPVVGRARQPAAADRTTATLSVLQPKPSRATPGRDPAAPSRRPEQPARARATPTRPAPTAGWSSSSSSGQLPPPKAPRSPAAQPTPPAQPRSVAQPTPPAQPTPAARPTSPAQPRSVAHSTPTADAEPEAHPGAPAVPAVPMLVEGETLHAQLSGPAADAGSTFVWQRCVPGVCTTVAGEHKVDYQLTAADLHTRIRVVVTRRGGQRLSVTTTAVVGTLTAASRAPASLVSPLVPTDAGTLTIVLAAGPHRSLQRPPTL